MEALKYFVFTGGVLCLILAYLHSRKLIKPSKGFFYSAKGSLYYGLGFTAFGAFLAWEFHPAIKWVLLIVYLPCLFLAKKYEKPAREAELNKSLNTDASDAGAG